MSWLDSVAGAARKIACDLSKTTYFLGDGLDPEGNFPPYALGQKLAYQDRQNFCTPAPYDEPFLPGICPALYRVTVTYQITGHPNPIFNEQLTWVTTQWGPIGTASPIREEADAPGGRQILRMSLMTHGPAPVPREESFVRVFNSPQEFHELATATVLNIQSEILPLGSDPSCPDTFEREPYNPDNWTINVDINLPNAGGVTINVPFVAVVGLLKVDANLNLSVPITFKIAPTFRTDLIFRPEFSVNVNLGDNSVTNNYTDGWDPLPTNQPPPADPSNPGTKPTAPAPPQPPSVPDADPDPDDVEAGRVIVGALVTTTALNPVLRQTVIGQTGNPSIYAPSLGFVSFAIQLETGEVGWTSDIAVKNLRSYIPCPVPTGAVQVRGTAQPGNSWVVTPVYREVSAEVT